jgi:transcriptional regulator with XRE-family HTH domain
MSATQEPSSVRLVLARSIQELRKLRGITQEELSTITGITRSHISAIEHGRCNIRLDNIDKIARALGVPLRQLFDEKGGEEPGDQHPPFHIGESSGWYRVINPPSVSMRLSGVLYV